MTGKHLPSEVSAGEGAGSLSWPLASPVGDGRERQVTVRELSEARRVLAGALRDLRHLERQVAADIQQLRNRAAGARGGPNGGPAQARPRPAARLPRELPEYEAARNAIEDVLARWESREAQLDAEVHRRGARKPRR